MSDRYAIPGGACRVEEEVKRSRFIATLGPAASVAEARGFIAAVRAEFPDASHHGWAFAVGPPGATGNSGMSDDGEPHGTAGRPMLNVLHHSGLGDVVVVVSRYFGGTELGKGGLVRAYSGAAQRAVNGVGRSERVVRATLRVALPYAGVSGLKRLLPGFEARLIAETFEDRARFDILLPESQVAALLAALQEMTNGKVHVEPPLPSVPDPSPGGGIEP